MRKMFFLLSLLSASSFLAYPQEIIVQVDQVVYKVDTISGTAGVGQNFTLPATAGEKPQGTLKGKVVLASSIKYRGKQYPVTSISPYAFDECNELISITIPGSVNEIDHLTFNNYLPNLKQIIVSPENQYFQSFDGILFSKDLKQIYRFPTGRNDTTYTLPSTVESIEYGAFSSCKKLMHIVLSDNVKYIRNNAFEFCYFKTIDIPKNVVEIGENAFYYCIDLIALMIPYSVKKIGAKAFSNCYDLKSFICQNEKLIIPSDAFEGCVKSPDIIYKVPASALIELAQDGDPEYQYRLAMSYLNGEGLQKDLKSAGEWFEKSANRGYVLSQKALGDMYLSGMGKDKNLTEAIKWYSLAAKNGNVFAQSFLGDCYFDAVGTKQNLTTAFNYYKSAADQGDTICSKKVAYCYYYGKGIGQDYNEAGKWYMKTANIGDAESAYYVALMHYDGKGLEKNDAEALKWVEKAVVGGIEESKLLYCELAYKDAVSSMDGGYYNLAIARFTSLLEYEKESADIWINRGYCYLQLKPKNYANAEADFKKALELDKDNKAANDNLQVVNDHYKKLADAKAFCDEGYSYVAVKDYVNAVSSYAKAVYLDDTNPYPYTCIGFCYYACQQYADAIGFFDKAIEVDPDFTDAIQGRKMAKTNMFNQAINNALNSYSNSLNNAYNSSSNYDGSSYDNQSGNNSSLNDEANRAVYREQKKSQDKYNMYMRLYEQEQAESDSYFKRYQNYGSLDDLMRSKECQSRANDYLETAKIWK